MNKHIKLVEKWLNDKESVTQEELEQSKKDAADAVANAYATAYTADAYNTTAYNAAYNAAYVAYNAASHARATAYNAYNVASYARHADKSIKLSDQLRRLFRIMSAHE